MFTRISTVFFILMVSMKLAMAGSVIESWDQIKAPPAPTLSSPTVKAAETALLLLDIEEATCNNERRPRCVAAVPTVAAFLKKARKAHMPVFHSNTMRGSRATFLPPVSPKDNEPIVQSTVNKFFRTKLDEHLKAKNIKTVIVCGTAAIGAAMHTATAAAQYGYKVILPVDCVTGGSLYEEQAAVWSLINGPGTMNVLTPTTLSRIKIEK
ncbi:MAG: isochorismatase family protein [Oxalobacter sp.]|nr:MAG: isochorismatase family protein [Oxalobacter sp.]